MKIDTIYGPMEEHDLRRNCVVEEDELKRTNVVEYYFRGQLVHRSAHITLKQNFGLNSQSGAF
jgi:hypothetical protein